MSVIQLTLFLLSLLFGIILIGLLLKDYQNGVIGFSEGSLSNSVSLGQNSNVPFLEEFQSQSQSQSELATHTSHLQEDPEKWYSSGDNITRRSQSSSTLYSYLHPKPENDVNDDSCNSSNGLTCSSCGSMNCNGSSCPMIGKQSWRTYRETPMNRHQDTEIEELREVLKNTIDELHREKVLPPGTTKGCAKPPIVAPNGMVISSPECRPPGWLRFIEKRNQGLLLDDDELINQ
jgi:hypothetical protein